MYDHIGLKVGDLDASVRFYTAALAPLGYVLCSRDASGAGFGPKGEPALWLYSHKGPAPAAARPAKATELGPRGTCRQGKQQKQRGGLAHHLVSSSHGFRSGA